MGKWKGKTARKEEEQEKKVRNEKENRKELEGQRVEE
jgi:hypothetical protein